MMFVCLVAILMSAFAVPAHASEPAAQRAAGLQFVLKVEMRPTDKKATGEPYSGFALPTKGAEIEYVTDGRAVRSTLRGEMVGTTDGTVTLALPGEAVRHVLHPGRRTVESRPVVAPQPPAGTFDSSVAATRVSDTYEGHRVRKFLVSYRQFATPRDQRARPKTDAATQTVEIELWCSTEFRVPPALTSMTNGALSFLTPTDARQFATACPLAIRTMVRMSSSPGYETVSTISSIRRVSPDPELFRIPKGYRSQR